MGRSLVARLPLGPCERMEPITVYFFISCRDVKAQRFSLPSARGFFLLSIYKQSAHARFLLRLPYLFVASTIDLSCETCLRV